MLGAAWTQILLAIAVAACLVALPKPAAAQFHVAQPEVVKGQGEIADHGAVYAGPGTVEKLDQAHQLELYYGLTDRLAFLTVGLLQQKIGENLGGRVLRHRRAVPVPEAGRGRLRARHPLAL